MSDESKVCYLRRKPLHASSNVWPSVGYFIRMPDHPDRYIEVVAPPKGYTVIDQTKDPT